MTKKEARRAAIDYLWSAADGSYCILAKTTIDCIGTQSEAGYTDDDCDKIKKELDFLLPKLFQYELKR